MTNKEAFDALKRFKRCCRDVCPSDSCGECGYNVTDKEWNEAFEKALDALEEPENGCFGSKKCECHEKTTDKTIPDSIREAVLNVLDDYADKTLEIESGAYERARYAIGKILEGRKRRWIPCSERMPESDGTLRGYLVSIGYWVGIMSCFNGKFIQCVNGKLEEPKYRVKAWMPLPDPYMEDDDD